MELLSPDALRITALKLPLSNIFKLCQTNKRFQQQICNYKPFWEALFLREIEEKIEIPKDASIDWYKEKIKDWPSIKNLVELIRENIIQFKYIQPFNKKWNRFEIVENLQELNCPNNQLISLPSMPNLQLLYCGNNKLTSLSAMPNLKILNCDGNQLTSLSSMPKLQHLVCENNKFISFPYMPNLLELWCENNQLTSLPPAPNLRKLSCKNNQLTFLPSYPKLEQLFCENNKLTFLPPMPNLLELRCRNNPLPGFTLEYWKSKWFKSP